MGFFPSLPNETNLSDIFKAYPNKGVEHLLKYHDAILREPSPLTIGERELIAAYVSGLNQCNFCLNAHSLYAETYGNEEKVFAQILDNIDSAEIDEKLKPVLHYVRKLTLAPKSIEKADADAIFNAGWSEEALHDIIMVTALFNFMNRIILGAGVDPFDEQYEKSKAAVRKRPIEKRLELNKTHIGNKHYQGFGKHIGIIEKD